MTCDQSELRMAELLAGEMAPADREDLDRHLLECETCREDFEFARAGARVEWADVPVPPALLEATLASIHEAPAAVRFFRWATAAAALLGVAVLLVTSGRSRPQGANPEPVMSAAACRAQRRPVLASMQEPILGALACQDDAGRPVGDLGLKSHDVSVEIQDGIAKTTVEEDFENHTDRRLEGTFTFPLPSDASISRLALEVNGKLEEGTCLERERARQVFESIVRRMQDPALLEWQPGGLFKCRIFPIEPRATKRVIVAYTQTLPCFQGKMRYVYPLASEKTRTHPPGELRIHVLARFSGALSNLASTSHHLDVQRKDAHEASMSFRATNYRPNNDFVVTLEPTEEEVRVVCHKPQGEDGYFACFVTPKASSPRVPQKYTFVVDASASISAPRLEVAKRLVRAMMERKMEGDGFEVLSHSIETRSSGEVDLRGANAFMDQLRPIGGSDVLGALEAAGPGEIIYIGKGQPTFGETETARILDAVKGRRIRTIAVGSDANLPLLERLGGLMRITPNDEVDKRVGEIAATLGSPVISGLQVEGDHLSDLTGARDVFAGERVVLVGRYRGAGTGKVVVHGRGYRREVDVSFPEREEANNPVRRLWAQRKVADLVAMGESTKAEVTNLGVKYQIMTPYTSFLVLESEQMWKEHQLQREVQKQDQVLGKAGPPPDDAFTVEVTRKVAHLLELAYMAADQKKFDRTIHLCDEILSIDPNYPVARDLRQEVEKTRQKEEYSRVLGARLEALKKLTDEDEQPKIPQRDRLRIPSPQEWAEVSKRLTPSVIRTEGGTSNPEAGESLAVHRKLDTMKLDLAFENTKLEDALTFLRDSSGMNIVLDAEVRDRVDPEQRVTFKAADLSLKEDLRGLIAPFGLDYTVTADNVVLLTTPSKKLQAEAGARPEVWGDLLNRLKSRDPIDQQGKSKEADEHYRLAEGYYTAGDFKKSLGETQKALELVPQHAPSQALHHETQFILGRGAATPSALEYDGFLRNALVREEQIRREADSALDKGRRLQAAGEVADANREFRKVLDYSSWIPAGVDLEDRRKLALELSGGAGGTTSVNGPTGQVSAGFSSQETARPEPGDLQRQSWTTNASAPGAPMANELPIEGKMPMTGAPSRQPKGIQALTEDLEEVTVLDPGISGKVARTGPLQRRIDDANQAPAGAEGDLQVLVHQQEVQLAQIQELSARVDEHRAQLAKSLSEKSLAPAELQHARQLADRLKTDLRELDEKHLEMGREKKQLEETINAIAQAGGNVGVPPMKALEAKVTAVANEIGLVVISVGKDDGVLEADEFSIYRGGGFVAKLAINRADRKWSAGKVVLKSSDPKVGDDASNHRYVGPPPLKRALAGKVTALAAEAGLVVISLGKDDGVGPGDEFAIRRGGELVATIVIDRAEAAWAAGKIVNKKRDPKVFDDVTREKASAPRQTLSPEERLDLQSAANLDLIRAKMGLKE